MNEQNTQILNQLAPKLYRDLHGNPRATGTAFGFECGDGWFELLKEASIAIEAEINRIEAQMTPEELKQAKEDCTDIKASQIKEKFGNLRFYIWGGNETIDQIIKKAETKSAKTCEVCGKPGKLSGWGWYSTLCGDCEKL